MPQFQLVPTLFLAIDFAVCRIIKLLVQDKRVDVTVNDSNSTSVPLQVSTWDRTDFKSVGGYAHLPAKFSAGAHDLPTAYISCYVG